MKLPIFLLSAVMAFATSYADAQEEENASVSPSQLPEDFSEVDRDGDGEVSIAEAREVMQDLVIVDRNNDSKLNRSELEVAMPELNLDEDDTFSEDYVIGEEEYGQLLEFQKREDRGVDQASSEAAVEQDQEV